MRRDTRIGPNVRALVAGALALTGCATDLTTPRAAPAYAKAGGSPTVTAADPAYGKRGETNKQVSILGSGFQAGDQVSWQRGGAVDPKIEVLSTQFVSSTQLIATVNIAVDAELAFYDIAVTGTGRKGGIGTEKFEVTTAILLADVAGTGNTSVALGISDGGVIVGRSKTRAVSWSAIGLEDLGSGRATDVDAAGTTVVGTTSPSTTDGMAMMWTGGPAAWVASPLSTGCVSGQVGGSVARAVSADGLVAGGQVIGTSRNKSVPMPALWDLTNGSCQLLGLPSGSSSARVHDVTSGGDAVGMAMGATNRAVVWSGGVPVILAPLAGFADGDAEGISRDGSIVVGMSGGRPVYWVRGGGGWSAAIGLTTGPCQQNAQGWANDVSDQGMIVGKGCDGGSWAWQLSAGVVTSSWRLRGIGPGNGAAAEAVRNGSGNGAWVVGSASDRAVYWNQP